tara:strand:+ start:58 stop:366 length:309 start_codon:yes stop_codon:yes gene_type:complete
MEKLKENTMSVYANNKKYKVKKGYLELSFNNKEWFNNCEFFTIYNDVEYNYLHIKKHYIDIPHGARNLIKCSRFGFFANIPLGNYEIDKGESNEDELIIYYN